MVDPALVLASVLRLTPQLYMCPRPYTVREDMFFSVWSVGSAGPIPPCVMAFPAAREVKVSQVLESRLPCRTGRPRPLGPPAPASARH